MTANQKVINCLNIKSQTANDLLAKQNTFQG